jgi:uncharacterized protein
MVAQTELVVVTGQRLRGEGFTPSFKVLTDGVDRTAALSARLLTLTLTDNSGGEADTLELSFDDSQDTTFKGGAIEVPRKGAWLELSLGYLETGLLAMGRFIVDETEISGPPDVMTVRARSADVGGARTAKWKAHKSRSHATTTLGALVTKIAREHGQEAAIAPDVDSLPIPAIAQSRESDLHFLTRVARREGAVFALKGGKAVVVKRGAPRTAAGVVPEAVTFQRSQLTSWRLTQATRDSHGSVRARWRDKAAARERFASAGTGDPKRTLRSTFASEAEAQSGATAELARLTRNTGGALEVTVSGRAALAAGGRIVLDGVRSGLDGTWVVETVEHQMDWSGGGYTCRLEGRIEGKKA